MTQAADAPPAEGKVAKLFPEQRPPLERDDRDPDELELAISGVVKLDRTNEEHVRLFNSFRRIGQRVEITTEVIVVALPLKGKFDEDGNLAELRARKQLKLDDCALVGDLI